MQLWSSEGALTEVSGLGVWELTRIQPTDWQSSAPPPPTVPTFNLNQYQYQYQPPVTTVPTFHLITISQLFWGQYCYTVSVKFQYNKYGHLFFLSVLEEGGCIERIAKLPFIYLVCIVLHSCCTYSYIHIIWLTLCTCIFDDAHCSASINLSWSKLIGPLHASSFHYECPLFSFYWPPFLFSFVVAIIS